MKVGEHLRCLVVGGGVVGLACGLQLARAGWNVVVAERHRQLGTETSSRNSEVIHSGLYYPPETLKTRLCVLGRKRLIAYCEARSVPYRLCGKLIVAVSDEQRLQLAELAQRASRNHVSEPLQHWSSGDVSRRFSAVSATDALWSPGTGIIDSHAFVMAMARDIEDLDGVVLRATEVVGFASGAQWSCQLRGFNGTERHHFDAVINAAGHSASIVAALAGVPAPIQYAVKGSYFRIVGPSPVDTLVYPLPMPDLVGLGVHLTLDLAGRARLGPDVEVLSGATDSAMLQPVNPALAEQFAASARYFLPGLATSSLRPAFSGARPKLAVDRFADFHVAVSAPGFVQLSGIESPGLTASLAIGAAVAELLN